MGNIESRGHLEGYNLSSLNIDQAYLNVNSSFKNVSVYSLSSNCVECTPSLIEENVSKVDTKYKTTFLVTPNKFSDSNEKICRIEEPMGEFGVYQINTDGKKCSWEILKEPVNIYWPILVCLAFYLIIAIIWFTGKFIYKKFKKIPEVEENSEEDIQLKSASTNRQRVKSLDTFRGIAIVLMIFVNNGGGVYYFFEHATWDGLFIADLVFPWFLWIMGVCIPISTRSALKRSTPTKTILRIVKRSFYLFLLGLIVGAGVQLEHLRIFGVLQRFAFTYLIVASLCLMFHNWFEKDFQFKHNFLTLVKDVVRLVPHWIIILLILIAHCLIVFLLPVPECPKGYLGPGGRHKNSSFFNCTGGSSGYVDRIVVGPNHLLDSLAQETYSSILPFDPEGIVGTLTSCVQVFLGVQAGSTLLSYSAHKPRIIRWLSWGTILGVLAAILCKGSMSNGWIPINKQLWSLSYVMVTSSFAFILLTICYILIDVKKLWSGTPFYYAGMNAILLYCGHMITYRSFPFYWQTDNMNTHMMQLIVALWTTTVWILISVWLHHIKFFLSL